MLGQENIREQLAVDQMDVDELSNGEQHYEDRLSSEIECKLSCEFQENPGPSCASSDSQHSESTNDEPVMQIDNAASEIKEAEDFLYCSSQENPGPSCASSDSQHSESTGNESVIGIDNDAASGIKEAASYFVNFFIKGFYQKISEYGEEAKPGSKLRKPSSVADTLYFPVDGGATAGLHPPGCDPVSVGGKVGYALVKKTVDFITGNNHRQKAINVCEVIDSFNCTHRKVLAEAGSEICQKFERQFNRCMVVGKHIKKRHIQKLAVDAVDRVLSYVSTNGSCYSNGNAEEAFFDLITKGVILGESKRKTAVKAFHFKPAGSKVRDSESSVDLITSELYGNVGIKKRDDGVTKYYKLKKDDYSEKYGYRFTFGWELKNWQEIEQKYKLIERSEEEPEPVLDEKETKKISSAALEKLDGQDLVTMKTMVDIEDHLRRQDEDRCHFSYCFDKLAKFFIERKEVTKELNLKLNSKSQEIKMSRVVLIYGKSGVGKTEFARGYGFSARRCNTWEKIMWIDALEHAYLKNSFSKLAEELGIPIKIENERDRDIESIVKDIYERLRCTRSFFVFDRAPSYEEIERFLPANFPSLLNRERPFIVITSNKSWQKEGIEEIELGSFDPKESDEFLGKALEKNESQNDISKLGKALNYHPFALAQTAASINQRGESISSYLEKYKRMQKSLELQGDNGKSFGILKINIDKIKGEENIGPQSYAMLEFMAYLNSYPINIKNFFFGKIKRKSEKNLLCT